MKLPASDVSKKAVCLMSLGSAKPAESVALLYMQAAQERGHHLMFCPLDSLELINRRVLYEDASGPDAAHIAGVFRRIQSLCHHNNGSGPWYLPYSSVEANPDFTRYEDCFLELFNTDRRFQSEVRNQTFRNLQPVLRRNAIDKKQRSVLNALAEFLLKEIAFKCYLGNEVVGTFEYALAPQMKVMEDVYSGRYSSVRALAQRKLQFICIGPDA